MKRAGRPERVFVAAAIVVGLLAWEAGARTGLISKLLLPAPSVIAAALINLFRAGTLGGALAATLARTSVGVLVGCVPAALIGLAMGWSPRVRGVLDPIIAAFHPLPKIAVLPLLMVMFGIGETSKILAVALGAFFPMLLSAAAGVRQINPLLFEVARSYGAGRRKVLTRVVLPGALPLLLTGLRLSINVALLITIAVELVAARTGLGTVIWLAWETMRTEQLFAGLIVIASVGVALNLVLGVVARRLVPWQRDVAA